MKKRLTFVGIAPCGHPGYVAQDPETYKHRLRVEDVAEEYKSLVDDLRGNRVAVHKDTHPAEFAMLFEAFLGTLKGEP